MTDGGWPGDDDDGWLCRDFGSWAYFACFVAGMAAGYLGRPPFDWMAAAVRLWWEYNSSGCSPPPWWPVNP